MTTAWMGVCSWSLQPATPEELAARLREIGARATQLALDPIRSGAWSASETLDRLSAAGIAVPSGMISMAGEDYSTLESIRETGGVRSEAHWEENLAAAAAGARLAREMGIRLVSFHAGFLPEAPYDPLRSTMIRRLRQIVDAFSGCAVDVALETGQETVETLLDVLEELDRRTVGVNFDPANMILYDKGDPVAALKALAPHVRQIHLKDARRTQRPGEWGVETPIGEGQVPWPAFAQAVRAARLRCNLMIERESGADRAGDVAAAVKRLRPLFSEWS